MSSFEIQGTVSLTDQFVPDWFQDLHLGEPEASVLRKYAMALSGEVKAPSKVETSRKRLAANWQFIGWLLHNEPGHLDEILTAYVEKTQGE